jgi:hypothetical protein
MNQSDVDLLVTHYRLKPSVLKWSLGRARALFTIPWRMIGTDYDFHATGRSKFLDVVAAIRVRINSTGAIGQINPFKSRVREVVG